MFCALLKNVIIFTKIFVVVLHNLTNTMAVAEHLLTTLKVRMPESSHGQYLNNLLKIIQTVEKVKFNKKGQIFKTSKAHNVLSQLNFYVSLAL